MTLIFLSYQIVNKREKYFNMTSRMQKRVDDAMMECYRRLFRESTPSGNFDYLVETASLNDRGQKEIPFLDYELEESKWEPIFKEIYKEYKIPKYLRQSFRISIVLGCSPKTKMNC